MNANTLIFEVIFIGFSIRDIFSDLEPLLIFVGIIVGLSILGSLPEVISNGLTNYKYHRRLKKITPDLVSFNLEKKRQDYMIINSQFKLIQKDLISNFKFKIDNEKAKTIDDLIKSEEKERNDKRKKSDTLILKDINNLSMFSQEQKNLLDKLSDINKIDKDLNLLSIEIKRTLEEVKKIQSEINKVIEEKSKGFPWLSDRIAEYFELRDFSIAEYLEKKFRPAISTAERVKEIAKEKRLLRSQFLIAKNFVNYYETLFPWITEYIGENLDDLLKSLSIDVEEESEKDPVLKFIKPAEYTTLSEEIRNQKALDRYFATRGHPWQIGRDYERYIGYLYEMKGYQVNYEGIEKGLEDLGRDLVRLKGSEVEIIQCKCWANYKTIHEKHINQLYGTAVKYYIEHKQIIDKSRTLTLFPELIRSGEIKATFITTTKLSDTAKKFADALGIKVEQEKPLQKYPVIKCNISSDGNKIYHLPFDQQYDTTLIKNPGEFYASTVQEAMSKGFRRAYRWRGMN